MQVWIIYCQAIRYKAVLRYIVTNQFNEMKKKNEYIQTDTYTRSTICIVNRYSIDWISSID